jgi:AcrR family transcriptional regulator
VDKTARRQELLRAAREVFATKGYHDAKVDDIVAAAKVAKGTFYLYFKDKRSIFSELVDGFFMRIGGAILRVDAEADVEAQVKHNIRAIVAVLLDDPLLAQILLSYATGLDAAFVTKIQSFYDGAKTMLRAALGEGQRLGIVSDGDTALYATFTIGALKEIILEQASGQRVRPREEIVSALFALLQAGYLRIASARSPSGAPEPRTPKRTSQRPRPPLTK